MHWFWIVVLVACTRPAPPPPVLAVPATKPAPASPFDRISLHAGMQREQAENEIAKALGKERSEYSPYGNNLRGGTVEYTDGTAVLEVVYQAGTAAPWVVGANGVAEHYPPTDEAVISFRTYRR